MHPKTCTQNNAQTQELFNSTGQRHFKFPLHGLRQHTTTSATASRSHGQYPIH